MMSSPSSPPSAAAAAVAAASPSRPARSASDAFRPPAPAARLLCSKDFVRHHLLTEGPAFVSDFKRHHGWLEESEGLPLLDLSGLLRGEFFLSAQTRLQATLLETIKSLSEESRLLLLRKSLPYIDVPELHEIPKTLLELMSTLPEDLCDLLRTLPVGILDRLSYKIRQKLWEGNLDSFVSHIVPHIDRYVSDPNVMRTLDEMPFKPITVKNRLAIPSLKKLIEATQMSSGLYKQLALLLRRRFVDTGIVQLCTLQSDVLNGMRAAAIEEKKTLKTSALLMFMQSIPIASLPTNLTDLRAKFGTAPMTEQYATDFGDVKRRAADLKQFIKNLTNTKSADVGKSSLGFIVESVLKDLEQRTDLSADEFAISVWEKYPNITKVIYTRKIDKPMDFATIRRKSSQNQYNNLQDFVHDLKLIASNCAKFNKERLDMQYLIANGRELMEVVAPKIIDETVKSFAPQNQRDPTSLVADAAMCLWDPTCFHALAKLLFDAIELDVVKDKRLPRESQVACDLLWLMELACDAREWARASVEQSTTKTLTDGVSPDRLHNLLPYLALLFVDGVETKGTMNFVLDLPLATDAIARECLLRYLFQRIRAGDLRQAPVILDLVAPFATVHLGLLRSLVGALESAPKGAGMQPLRRKALVSVLLPYVETNPRSNEAHLFFAQGLVQDEGMDYGDPELLRLARKVLMGIDHAWYASSRCKRVYEKDFFGPRSPFAAERSSFGLPTLDSLKMSSPMSLASAGPTSASPGSFMDMSPPMSSASPGGFISPGSSQQSPESSQSPPQSVQSSVSVQVTEGEVVWE